MLIPTYITLSYSGFSWRGRGIDLFARAWHDQEAHPLPPISEQFPRSECVLRDRTTMHMTQFMPWPWHGMNRCRCTAPMHGCGTTAPAHVRTPFPCPWNGWMHCAESWCVVRTALSRYAFYASRGCYICTRARERPFFVSRERLGA